MGMGASGVQRRQESEGSKSTLEKVGGEETKRGGVTLAEDRGSGKLLFVR